MISKAYIDKPTILCYSCFVYSASHRRRVRNSFPGLTPSLCPALVPPASVSSRSLVSKSFPYLVTSLPPYFLFSKSFNCNTYGYPCKCCKQKTYGLAKSFRCNTYKKHGVASFKPNISPLSARSLSTSHLPYALPSCVSRKSIICHSYENTGGVGVFFPFRFNALSVAGACEPAWASLPTLPFQLSIEDPDSVGTVDRRSRLGRNCRSKIPTRSGPPLCLYSTGHGS